MCWQQSGKQKQSKVHVQCLRTSPSSSALADKHSQPVSAICQMSISGRPAKTDSRDLQHCRCSKKMSRKESLPGSSDTTDQVSPLLLGCVCYSYCRQFVKNSNVTWYRRAEVHRLLLPEAKVKLQAMVHKWAKVQDQGQGLQSKLHSWAMVQGHRPMCFKIP